MTKLRLVAVLLALALAAGGCGRSAGPAPGATSTAATASSTVAPPASSPDPAVSGWPAFTSVAGGYRLRYPPGWRVKESTGSGGPVLSLLPPKGAGISVLVTSTAPPSPGAGNPGVRCQPVRVGRLVGERCLDPEAMVVTTTLKGREWWYAVTAGPGRPPVPTGTYDRVLGSFRLR